MKKLKKRIMSLALALTLAFGCCAVVDTTTTQAATKNYMEKHNIKKGKVDKKYKINIPVENLKKKQTNYYYITGVEIEDAVRKGYKTATFTVKADLGKVDYSKIPKDKLYYDTYVELCHFDMYGAVIDMKTGKSVATSNGKIQIDSDGYKLFNTPDYYTYTYNGSKQLLSYYDAIVMQFEVYYPKSYKNLAIVYGMTDITKYPNVDADYKFLESKGVSFSKTSFYKSKKTCRYIPLN